MTALSKLNSILRANPLLYMTVSATLAITIQLLGLELHKRAQAAKERKEREQIQGSAQPMAPVSDYSSPSVGGYATSTAIRPSR